MRTCLLLLLAAALAGCNPPPPEQRGYGERIAAARAAKDAQFQRTNDPVPANRKAAVLPLEYYPIDPAYKVPGVLRPDPKARVVTMITSTGSQEQHRVLGTMEFTVNGETLQLTAFASADSRVFVPFQDQTSGTETYGSGRYIDLVRTGTNIYELDFNTAYNPYCYYSLAYVCPLPPQENRLRVPIRAGEKIRPDAKR